MKGFAEGDTRPRLSVFREVIRTVPRSMRRGYLLGIVISTVSEALLPLGLKVTVDGAVRQDAYTATTGVVLLSLFAAGWDSAGRAHKDLMVYWRHVGGFEIAVRATRAISHWPTLEHIESPEHHDQVRLITTQGPLAAATLTDLVEGVRTLILIVFPVVLLVSVDPLLGLFPLFVLPSVLLGPIVHRLKSEAQERATEPERQASALNDLLARPEAAMELRAFGALANVDAEADRLDERAASIRTRGELRSSFVAAAGLLVLVLGYVAALSLVATKARHDPGAAGSALMVINIASQLRGRLQESVGIADQLRGGLQVLDRLAWLNGHRPGHTDSSATTAAPAALCHGLELHEVTFTYPGTQGAVLQGLSLSIPAGSLIAIVGDNGAGKSTLVKLLLGLYRPTSGAITIDGIDLASIPPEVWWAKTSAAYQDHLHLEDAFRHSVLPWDHTRSIPDLHVTAAAERGDALSLTHDFDEGFDTHLGTTYRQGRQLSGGQWQRIAVARAMGRAEPLLMVLDEPTAALDPAAEHRLYERYVAAAETARASGGITLLVSHRFSSVQMADHIVVLEAGTVAEQGTHTELMSLNAQYASMFKRQAAAYQ